jgi:homoserine dehydrogenase
MSEIYHTVSAEAIGIRAAMRRMCKAVNDLRFTDLIKHHCAKVKWRKDHRGYTLKLVMTTDEKRRDMRALLSPNTYQILHELFHAESDIYLYNVTTDNL